MKASSGWLGEPGRGQASLGRLYVSYTPGTLPARRSELWEWQGLKFQVPLPSSGGFPWAMGSRRPMCLWVPFTWAPLLKNLENSVIMLQPKVIGFHHY